MTHPSPRAMTRPLMPMPALAALLAAGLLAGCAGSWQTESPVTPSSYQSARDRMARTEGKLRRLAVLALDQAAPKACGRQTDNEATIDRADDTSRQQLVDAKGYELVEIDAQRLAAWLDAPALAALGADILARLVDKPGAAPAAGSPLQRLLERLRTEGRADGLLVLHRRTTCSNAITPLRAMLGIGTLGLSEVWPDERLQQLDALHGGAMFETASGRLVWRLDTTAEVGARVQDYFSFGGAARPGFARVIDALEPAVPRLLTR